MRDIIFIGDGLGVRTFPARAIGLNVLGTDISKHAVNNSYCKECMVLDDVSNTKLIEMGERAKVIVLYDICEHLSDEQLHKAMKNIIQISNNFVFSVPVLGDVETGEQTDPNLMNDKTHLQFKTRREWIKFWESYGLKITEAPKDWAYHQQIFIGERK